MYKYKIYPDKKICVFKGRESVTTDEIKIVAKAFVDDENWNTDWDVLFDLNDMQIKNMTYHGAKYTAGTKEKYTQLVGNGKRVYVTNIESTYGMLRMWESVTNNQSKEIIVVKSMDEALEFLDLSDLNFVDF